MNGTDKLTIIPPRLSYLNGTRLQHPASPHETPVTSPANKKARARAPESYARQQPDESEYDVHDMELSRQEYSQYASQPPSQHYAQPHRIEGAAV
jgi:hypothetical protein